MRKLRFTIALLALVLASASVVGCGSTNPARPSDPVPVAASIPTPPTVTAANGAPLEEGAPPVTVVQGEGIKVSIVSAISGNAEATLAMCLSREEKVIDESCGTVSTAADHLPNPWVTTPFAGEGTGGQPREYNFLHVFVFEGRWSGAPSPGRRFDNAITHRTFRYAIVVTPMPAP